MIFDSVRSTNERCHKIYRTLYIRDGKLLSKNNSLPLKITRHQIEKIIYY